MSTSIQQVSNYMRSDLVKARFAEVIGTNNAGAYISSALLAVANSKKLQECTAESVYISALRAATLRLSVDPSTGQAYLVPFGNQATLIVGYKGIYDMAVRTGRYRYINVGPIYEGENVEQNRISGFHSLTGNKKSDRIIGWLGAFEMRDGYAKTIYLTVEDCHKHAKKYSKSYTFKDSGWQTDPEAMERKTVLRILLRRWGYLDPSDVQTLESIEAEPNFLDVVPIEPEEVEKKAAKKNEKKLLEELGYKAEAKATEEEPRPWSATHVKNYIKVLVAEYGDKCTVTEDDRKVLASVLDTTYKGDKTTRYLACRWLLDAMDGSTKGMEPAQIKALLAWQGVHKFGDLPSEDAIKEAISVSTAALEAAGQSKLL